MSRNDQIDMTLTNLDFEHHTQRDIQRLRAAGAYMQHLAAHLHESGQRDRLLRLLLGNAAWMRTLFEQFGDDLAFVQQLESVIAEFEDPLGPQQLLELMQLQTARQVVHTRISLYTDQDLQVLALLNRTGAALRQARLRGDLPTRVNGLVAIAQMVKDRDHRQEILDEAKNISERIEDTTARAKALIQIAELELETDREQGQQTLDRALGAAKQLKDWALRGEILHQAGSILLQVDRPAAQAILTKAIEISVRVTDNKRKDSLLESVGSILAKAGMTAEATMAAAKADDQPSVGRSAKSTIINALIEAGSIEVALELVDDLPDDHDKRWVIVTCAQAMAAKGQIQQALDEANSLQEISHRDWVLREIASALASAGQILEARRIADMIQGSQPRSFAHLDLSRALARSGQIKPALRMAKEITDPDLRAQIYGELAQLLAPKNRQQAVELLRKATRTIQQLEEPDTKDSALQAVALAYATLGQVEPALDWALRSRSAHDQGKAVVKLLPAILPMGTLDRVLQAIHQQVESREQDRTLMLMVHSLTEMGENDHAMTVSEEIESVRMQIDALHTIAHAMATQSDCRGLQLLERAWDLSLGMADPREKRAALATVIESLTLSGQLTVAKQLILTIDKRQERAEAFLRVVRAASKATDATLKELLDDLVKEATHLPARAQTEILYQLVEILQDDGSPYLDEIAGHLLQAALGIFPATDREMMLLRIANNLRVRQKEASEAAMIARDEGKQTMSEWHALQWEEVWIAQLVEDQQTQAAVSSARAGEADSALKTARMINSQESRSRTLRTLVETLAQGGEIQAAQALAHEIGDPGLIATTITYAGNPKQALTTLGLCPLENYVKTLAFWGVAFDKLQLGLSVAAVREITRIAGWVRPEWRQVYLELKDPTAQG